MSEEAYMIKFINRITGTAMWVSEDRAEEYKAAGHKPAAAPVAVAPKAEPKTAPKTAVKKKTAAKRR